MPDASAHVSRKTIGIECESLEGSSWGIARLISKLLEHLAATPGIERTHRFILYSNGPLPDAAHFQHPAFVHRPIGLKRLRSFSLYYYILLPVRLWLDRPAVMYYPSYMLPLIHPPRVPSLVMLTEDVFREAANPRLPLRYRLAYRLFACFWAARRASQVMAISASSRDALVAEGIPAGRIAVNPLAVDAPRPDVATESCDILYVGQAFERRHLRETLQAFERLTAARPELTMRVIGPDKYEPRIIASLIADINARLKRIAIRWDEQVGEHELAAAYRGARVAVYVSDAEAFGLPPLEALSYGAVPVVADAPVNREIYGDAAFMTAPTVAAIAEAIEAALTDTARRDAVRAAAPGIVARYSWHEHVHRWLGMIATMTT